MWPYVFEKYDDQHFVVQLDNLNGVLPEINNIQLKSCIHGAFLYQLSFL